LFLSEFSMQIIYRRLRPQMLKHTKNLLRMRQLIHPRIFIFDIPKHDRIGRTGLRTSGDNLTVLDFAFYNQLNF
jgi:hypothetical protein